MSSLSCDKGQHFRRRKLISWRPSFMPNRQNHHMTLLFYFDLLLVSASAYKSNANPMALWIGLNGGELPRNQEEISNMCASWFLWYACLSLCRCMLLISARWQSRSKLMTLEWELVAVRKQQCVRFQHHGQHVTEHWLLYKGFFRSVGTNKGGHFPTKTVNVLAGYSSWQDKLCVQLHVFYRLFYADLTDLVWMCSHAWIHPAIARLMSFQFD